MSLKAFRAACDAGRGDSSGSDFRAMLRPWSSARPSVPFASTPGAGRCPATAPRVPLGQRALAVLAALAESARPDGGEGGPAGPRLARHHRRGGQPDGAGRRPAQGARAARRAGLDPDRAARRLPPRPARAGSAGAGGGRCRAWPCCRSPTSAATRSRTGSADGIVDDIITALSRFRSFAVVARTSSFAYKGRARRRAPGRAGARRALRAGGQRAAGRRPAADHRAARRRRHRRAALGRALRRGARRRLRLPGPHHRRRGDDRRAADPDGGDRALAARAAGQHRGLRRLPAGRAADQQARPRGRMPRPMRC